MRMHNTYISLKIYFETPMEMKEYEEEVNMDLIDLNGALDINIEILDHEEEPISQIAKDICSIALEEEDFERVKMEENINGIPNSCYVVCHSYEDTIVIIGAIVDQKNKISYAILMDWEEPNLEEGFKIMKSFKLM